MELFRIPVRDCVSHHSILNSSICFFMTTCAWLCLPRTGSLKETNGTVRWLRTVRGCDSHSHSSLKETNGTVQNRVMGDSTTHSYSEQFHLFLLRLEWCVTVSQPPQVVLKKQMELFRIEWWETQPRTGSLKETNGTVQNREMGDTVTHR